MRVVAEPDLELVSTEDMMKEMKRRYDLAFLVFVDRQQQLKIHHGGNLTPREVLEVLGDARKLMKKYIRGDNQ